MSLIFYANCLIRILTIWFTYSDAFNSDKHPGGLSEIKSAMYSPNTTDVLNTNIKGENAEMKYTAKPSIAVSMGKYMPVISNNEDSDKQEDEYISNLIRETKNYEFGRIAL